MSAQFAKKAISVQEPQLNAPILQLEKSTSTCARPPWDIPKSGEDEQWRLVNVYVYLLDLVIAC